MSTELEKLTKQIIVAITAGCERCDIDYLLQKCRKITGERVTIDSLYHTKIFKIGDVVKKINGGVLPWMDGTKTYIVEDFRKDYGFGGYDIKLKGHDNWFGTGLFTKISSENVENANFLDSISEEM